MRVQCPCCEKRFDLPILVVLAEAARLAERRKARPPTSAGGPPLSASSMSVPRCAKCGGMFKYLPRYGLDGKLTSSLCETCRGEVDGNVLCPQELEAKRLRDDERRKSAVGP